MEQTIKELGIYISDGNYSSKYPRSEEFVEEGVPFIRGNNMVDYDITDEEMYYITPEKHALLLKGHIKAGDVLITTRGNIGQVAIVPKRHENSNINAQIVLLRTDSEKLYNRCLDDINKEEIIGHLAKLVVSEEKDETAINFDVTMYGLILSTMTGSKSFANLKRHVVRNANILLKECATIPEVKAKLPQLKELINDDYWNTQDILKFEETRKSLRSIMKFIPAKKIKIHYTNFEDEVVFREEGRKLDLTSDDFEDYKERVNEYIEAHKSQPTINKLLHNEPISIDDYQELERIFTEELGTCEDYQMNYQDTPFGLLIRKIAKMNRDAAYAAFSSFIAEERPNAEQIHFIEQVVDYVVENGYINNVLDLMKAPFDRPYKFSMIFTRDEQIKFVQIINSIKNNALIA